MRSYIHKLLDKLLFQKKLNTLVDLYIIHVKNYNYYDYKMIKNIYKFNDIQKMKIIIELNEIIKTLFSNIDTIDNIKNKTLLHLFTFQTPIIHI